MFFLSLVSLINRSFLMHFFFFWKNRAKLKSVEECRFIFAPIEILRKWNEKYCYHIKSIWSENIETNNAIKNNTSDYFWEKLERCKNDLSSVDGKRALLWRFNIFIENICRIDEIAICIWQTSVISTSGVGMNAIQQIVTNSQRYGREQMDQLFWQTDALTNDGGKEKTSEIVHDHQH